MSSLEGCLEPPTGHVAEGKDARIQGFHLAGQVEFKT